MEKKKKEKRMIKLKSVIINKKKSYRITLRRHLILLLYAEISWKKISIKINKIKKKEKIFRKKISKTVSNGDYSAIGYLNVCIQNLHLLIFLLEVGNRIWKSNLEILFFHQILKVSSKMKRERKEK